MRGPSGSLMVFPPSIRRKAFAQRSTEDDPFSEGDLFDEATRSMRMILMKRMDFGEEGVIGMTTMTINKL